MDGHDRTASIVGMLLVVIVATFLVGCGWGTSTAADGDKAPGFTGVVMGGPTVSLSEFRGKPLVLAFMASW